MQVQFPNYFENNNQNIYWVKDSLFFNGTKKPKFKLILHLCDEEKCEPTCLLNCIFRKYKTALLI